MLIIYDGDTNEEMEALATILTSNNSWVTIIGLIVLILLLAFLSKKGLVSFSGKGLTVGISEQGQKLIRTQIEYCKTATETLAENLISQKKADEWQIKYICELIYDIYIEAISYNHITKDNFYIDNKFDKIWCIILREAETDELKTDDFKSVIYGESKKVIEKLVDIKDYYIK